MWKEKEENEFYDWRPMEGQTSENGPGAISEFGGPQQSENEFQIMIWSLI